LDLTARLQPKGGTETFHGYGHKMLKPRKFLIEGQYMNGYGNWQGKQQ
jgi:hypothetical protein